MKAAADAKERINLLLLQMHIKNAKEKLEKEERQKREREEREAEERRREEELIRLEAEKLAQAEVGKY